MLAAILGLTALGITPALAATVLTKQKADKRYLQNSAVVTATVTVPPSDGTTITVPCPAGRQATGGGAGSPAFFASNTGGDAGMLMLERHPLMSAGRSVGWIAEVGNLTSNPLPITAYAICAP